MSRFRKSTVREVPSLNTASLPDLIFTLLFFFMIVTNMREVNLKVQFKIPEATELQKLEKKSLVTYIYVGKATTAYQQETGEESYIQLNDALAKVSDIPGYIAKEREHLRAEDRDKMTVTLKIDKGTKMGLVTDIKQALRESNVLTINYAADKKENEQQ